MTNNKSLIPLIESRLSAMTPAEKTIAQYFLSNITQQDNLKAQAIAEQLNVSEASLTRFAQKCGFKGYRAFAYHYQSAKHETLTDSQHIDPVLASYQELLNKTHALINLTQIRRISQLMITQKRLYFYGKGSSGLVAREMKLRLMRIGFVCESITDDDMMRINKVMLDKDCLVIGISISGRTQIVIDALQSAKNAQAKTILFTANYQPEYQAFCDEIQLFAMKNQLDNGRLISPQFPALVMFDIVYADIMVTDPGQRDEIWQRTYAALQAAKE